MNRLDYVITSPSRQSQRSSWDNNEDMDSQFFSSFSSGSSSQDTQSTGIYLFSNFNTDDNNTNRQKSSISYRRVAKNVLLHPFKTTRHSSSLKTKLKSRIFSKTSHTQQHADFPDETDSIKVFIYLYT